MKNDDAQASEKPTAKDDEAKTVDDILKDTVPGKETSGKAKQYIKPGNYDDAFKDFKYLDPADIKDIPTGKRGLLSDGRDVNVRFESTEGSPTLEIYDRRTKRSIKIRYNSEKK